MNEARRVRAKRGRPGSTTASARRAAAGPTRARLLAVRILDRVERVRAFADLALNHALAQSDLSGADRALATELVYGTLRWRGRIDYLLAQVVDRPLDKMQPLVISTLRIGAYQLLFSDRIPANAAVDQAVRCVRAVGLEHATGLVNAVLRRLDREQDDLVLPDLERDPLEHLTHALSLPRWLAETWLSSFGARDAAALARASNRPPPLAVRVNRLRGGAEALLDELRERFPEAHASQWVKGGLILGRRGDPRRDPAFLAGRYTVQDESSQLVVSLLDPQPGDQVLDTCAAPGGKTTAIAERLGDSGEVLALDRHGRRLSLVARASRRLGLRSIRTLEMDATRSLADLPSSGVSPQGPAQFDRVLVDAPCSGLGSLRRNPDARWRISPEDPKALSQVQLAILQQAALVLRPGGALVYSTCTLLREENEAVVRTFLDQHPEYRIVLPEELPSELRPVVDEQGFMRCLPHVHDTDGMFAARMERTS